MESHDVRCMLTVPTPHDSDVGTEIGFHAA